MADRRDFMGYIGMGAIGSIVGYYVGAQKLLGIQPEETVRNTNLEQLPEQSTEQPTEEPTEQPTEQSGDLRVFDNFEDSELGWGVPNGERSTITFSDDSARGSQSLYFRDGAEDTSIEKEFDTPTSITQFNFWFKYNSNTDNNFSVNIQNSNGDRLIQIREFGRTVHYKNDNVGAVSSEPVADISQNTWYKVSISNISYDSDTLDIAVLDTSGSTVGSTNDVGFTNASEAADRVRIHNSLQIVEGPGGRTDPLWIDHITYKE